MPKHPAKFSDIFIPTFAEILEGRDKVLDPFGGVGKLALIKKHGKAKEVDVNRLAYEPFEKYRAVSD